MMEKHTPLQDPLQPRSWASRWGLRHNTRLGMVLGCGLTLLVLSVLPDRRWTEDFSTLLWIAPKCAGSGMVSAGELEAERPAPQQQDFMQVPWDAKLTLEEVERGLGHYGSGGRMRRVAAKLLAGEPIKVVTLGGSVTRGVGASVEEAKYASRFFQIINATFPHPDHEFTNKGIVGTSAGIFAACAEQMVPSGPDLVSVEFTYNEPADSEPGSPQRRGYEQLLRKLLQLPGEPAVMILHHYAWWFNFGDGLKGGLYYRPAEEQLGVFAEYYDIPSASVRASIWHLMHSNVPGFKPDKVLQAGVTTPKGVQLPAAEPGSESEYYYFDRMHPSDTGHAVMGEVAYAPLLRALQEVAAGAPVLPPGAADGRPGSAAAAVPVPMVPFNAETPTSLCAMLEDFKPIVKRVGGFEYRPERPDAVSFMEQKWGWTGLTPGDWAELEVDTRMDAANPDRGKGNKAAVYLSHLRSYAAMGTADVTCVSGCSCEQTLLDGTWARKVSLMQVHEFKVSQHQRCVIRVTVTDHWGEKKQKGHKVTLMAIMVSHFPLRLSKYREQAEEVTAIHN